MRPIADARDQAMLDRIDVTILDVAAEIIIVADQMFPEPTLPDGAFAARDADRAAPLGLGTAWAKPILISRQRIEKSVSPGGSVQTAWI